MARPIPDLRTYLEAVSGGPVAQVRHSAAVEERLSLALRGRYREMFDLQAQRFAGSEEDEEVAYDVL